MEKKIKWEKPMLRELGAARLEITHGVCNSGGEPDADPANCTSGPGAGSGTCNYGPGVL